MDELLKEILMAPGISGSEGDIAELMKRELEKSCDEVVIDGFGNVIAKKGSGPKKIMIAAHMDEVGLMVKHVSKEGFVSFVKIGGIDDRVLAAQRVVIKSDKGDVFGLIGVKPPHLQKEEERKKVIKHDEMFIDIGCASREEALKKISIGDPVVFEPNAGVLNGKLCYGKAVDNRVGCYAMIKIMEKLGVKAEVYAVATVQEEVGLKGAKTSSFKLAPDFALVIDTTIAGDTPQITENESSLKLGEGVAITIVEASGRGVIVGQKVKDLMISCAREEKVKYQIDVIEGGMTDGAMIYMNREGILTGVLSIPTRYVHSSTGVFSTDDVNSAVKLSAAVIEKFSKSK